MNRIMDKVLGFRNTSKPVPSLNQITMWYQKNPLGLPSTKSDADGKTLQDKYLSDVSQKYLQLLDRDFPKNCTSHIWLDREITLEMVEQSNIHPKEKEILTHLLQNPNIKIHTDAELKSLIDASSLEESDKTILHELNEHPITINMGAKNDIKKLLFCFLTEGNFNGYVDFDTLEKNTQASATKDVTGNPLKVNGHRNQVHIRYTDEQQEEHFKQFISDEAYQLRYGEARPEQTQQDSSYQKKPKKTITSLPKMGFSRRTKANDLLGMKQHDKKCLKTLRNMHEALKTGKPYAPILQAMKDGFLSSHYQFEFNQSILKIASLQTGEKTRNLSYTEKMEHYKLAAKLHQVIDSLTDDEKNTHISNKDNLYFISLLCTTIMQSAINLYTFLPTKYGSQSSIGFNAFKFNRLNKKIFGTKPEEVYTNSWQASDAEKPKNISKLSAFNNALKQGNLPATLQSDFQFLLHRCQEMEQEASLQTTPIHTIN